MMMRRAMFAVLSACLLTASPAWAGERAVTVAAAGNVRLSGTLLLPDGPAPAGGFPALLLVQGSGPTDRDGSQKGMQADLLKQVAAALAGKGIASLRLDKRGMHANAAQMPEDAAGLAAFYTWDAAIGDLAASYAALGGEAGIDPARTGILGHSEGALLLLAAADAGKVAPRAAVMLAGPGRPLGDLLAEQLTRLLIRQGAPPAVQQQFLDADRAIRQEIVATGQVPVDKVPPGLQALYPAYLGNFLHGLLTFDPAAAAGRARMPLLALFGSRDMQVSPEQDAAALRRTLSGRTDGSAVIVLDGLSHNMKRGDPGFTGPADPAALTAVTDWVAGHL
ncbi:alpha/beta hydrolase family protein [Niveispirillum fermenti]|uniref:alpha/beta hydrolase family protein n=1 Tax=Niveispirillum fermenti TaxID=1233113 RepID=UPI003A8892B2